MRDACGTAGLAAAAVDCDLIQVEGADQPRFLTFVDPTPETGVFPFARIAAELGRAGPTSRFWWSTAKEPADRSLPAGWISPRMRTSTC